MNYLAILQILMLHLPQLWDVIEAVVTYVAIQFRDATNDEKAEAALHLMCAFYDKLDANLGGGKLLEDKTDHFFKNVMFADLIRWSYQQNKTKIQNTVDHIDSIGADPVEAADVYVQDGPAKGLFDFFGKLLGQDTVPIIPGQPLPGKPLKLTPEQRAALPPLPPLGPGDMDTKTWVVAEGKSDPSGLTDNPIIPGAIGSSEILTIGDIGSTSAATEGGGDDDAV